MQLVIQLKSIPAMTLCVLDAVSVLQFVREKHGKCPNNIYPPSQIGF